MVDQSDKPQSAVKLPSLAITAQFIGSKDPPPPPRTQIQVPHVYIQPNLVHPAVIPMSVPFAHSASIISNHELLRPVTAPLHSPALSVYNVQHSITGQHLPQIPLPQSYGIPITFQFAASSRGEYSLDSHTQHNIPQSSKIEVIDMSHEIRSTTQRPRLPHICKICGKSITRDFSRHLRTHDRESRFKCMFPKEHCPHRTGCFNRQYDFKKHLLHAHFALRDHKVKRMKNLKQKLEHEGHCLCGKRMVAQKWLEHIVERDNNGKYSCTDLREKCDNTTDVL
jgi:hypothetical protein